MKISGWHVRAGIGALSLLSLGFVSGIVTDRIWLAHGHEPTVVATAAAHEPDHSAMVAFRQVLQLEDGQVGQIHEILMRHQVRVDAAWESIHAEVTAGVEDAHREIRDRLRGDRG